jgi:hypothetical protein
MALNNIAWLMEQPGVQHSSELARVLAFAASGGENGVINGDGLKVQANATPNNQVQVLPGVAAVVSTYAGHVGQTYLAQNKTATQVSIAATTSAGARTDAIILTIRDTGVEGQTPANVQTQNYVQLEVVQGVSSSLKYASEITKTYPFILLAKVTLPASTATVQASHITDLREIVQPRERTNQLTVPNLQQVSQHNLTSTVAYPTGQIWPAEGGPANDGKWIVRAPSWATQAEVRVTWYGVAIPTLAGRGSIWLTWGLPADPTSGRTQQVQWDADESSSPYRTNLITNQTINIPSSFRGKDLVFSPRARLVTAKTNKPAMNTASGFSLDIRWLERSDG